MDEIREMTARILQFRDERDWAQFHKPKDMLISLMLETAELGEHFQWKSEEEIKAHLESSKAEVADELSDVFYWVLLLAHDLGVNLKDAFERKMALNQAKYPVEKCKGRHTKYSSL